MKEEKETIETFIEVVANGRRYNFSFNGEFTLSDYIKKQTVRISGIPFLRVNGTSDPFDMYEESVVNIEEVASIKVWQDYGD